MTGGILALDLATRAGWAYASPAGIAVWAGTALEAAATPPALGSVVYGSFTLPKSGSDVGWFLGAYDDWIAERLDFYRPALVAFEAPWIGPQTHQDTARKLMCLAGHTEFACRRAGVQCREANNASVRKHFIGKGRGDRKTLKRLTMDACRARGWSPDNDDAADALGLLDYAVACWRPGRVAA